MVSSAPRPHTGSRPQVARQAARHSCAPAKAYRLLRAALNTAVDDGLHDVNPCRVKGGGVERSPERPCRPVTRCGRSPTRSTSVIGRWCSWRRSSDSDGASCSGSPSDVDLATRTVHVLRQIIEVDGRLEEGPPKSDAGVRAVAVPPVVAVELATHLERFVGPSPDAPVFVGAKGATPRRANFSPIWSRARSAVGRPDLHLHDLRHYANLMAASAGASTKELMSRLGHATPAAALRYQHATIERDQVIAARMEDLIGGRPQSATAPLRVLRGKLTCVTTVSRPPARDASFDLVIALSRIFVGAGDGNRTRIASLEGWNSDH